MLHTGVFSQTRFSARGVSCFWASQTATLIQRHSRNAKKKKLHLRDQYTSKRNNWETGKLERPIFNLRLSALNCLLGENKKQQNQFTASVENWHIPIFFSCNYIWKAELLVVPAKLKKRPAAAKLLVLTRDSWTKQKLIKTTSGHTHVTVTSDSLCRMLLVLCCWANILIEDAGKHLWKNLHFWQRNKH